MDDVPLREQLPDRGSAWPRGRRQANSGDVDVRGLTGTVNLASNAGDVSGDELAGARLRAKSSSGDVRLELVSSPASVAALSDSGDVDVDLPAGEYALDTHTDSATRPCMGSSATTAQTMPSRRARTPVT